MKHHVTALFLLASSPWVTAQDVPAPEPKKLPAISMLPDGSELKGVMLPRYDANRKLVGVLKASTMVLVSAGVVEGRTVTVEFFDADQTPRGRIDLQRATLYQDKGMLQTDEAVAIQSTRLNATGTGLYYSYTRGEGFLRGPGTTLIQASPQTTMKFPKNPVSAAVAGVAMISQPAMAERPPAMTPEDVRELHAAATSKAEDLHAAQAVTTAQVAVNAEDSTKASRAADTFISTTGVTLDPAAPAPAAKPLEVNPGPADTLIEYDGGMYFDADAGVLVYLKNVRVKDPRFQLSGARELKVFFSKKSPAKPGEKKAPEAKPDGAFASVGSGLGDVERVLADGAVLIHQSQTADGKPPIEASGAIFSYNVKSGEIILSGGYPWIKQGKNYLRAREPQLNLRIQKSGSFATEGKWDMGGSLEQKR